MIELCGPRKLEMSVDQHPVNGWPGSISRNNTGNKTFQVKQNQSWTPCKALWNHPRYCLGGSTAVLTARTGHTLLRYCTVSYIKEYHKASIIEGRRSCSSPGNLGSGFEHTLPNRLQSVYCLHWPTTNLQQAMQ